MRQQKVNDILTFLHRSRKLESQYRYRSSLTQNAQNSVAEHSWRLSLMVFIIGKDCKVQMNMEKAMSFALLHDLAEAKTGDIDAVDQIKQGQSLLDQKAILEDTAMHNMTNDLSFGDWIISLWEEYEKQECIEAKFVKALDKIEGFLHISEVGVENYILPEFRADYCYKAVTAFDEVTNNFPGLSDLLEDVKMNLKLQFEKVGVVWVDKQ